MSWATSAGATSYDVQRSTDGITFASVATPTATQYLDTAVTVGSVYYYKVAAVNGSGTSPYTQVQSLVPTPTAEMSLGEIRTRAQQRADRLNSNFVTLPEWNFFINQAMFELYDLLVTQYEDYFIATPATFTVTGNTFLYPLPDGNTTFTNGITGASMVAAPFYKLVGVDLALNASANGYVTVNKFNFADRNKFVYPNSASTIYGVFNLQYRLMGDKIEFIPTPSAGQQIRLWYIPRLNELLADSDLTTIGFSGWLQYVIVRAAKYALDKEESDTSKLDEELAFLMKRIEGSSMNRDAGQGDTIADIRRQGINGRTGPGDGFQGGWAVLPPILSSNNVGNGLLSNPELFSKSSLTYLAVGLAASYGLYLLHRKLGGWVGLSRVTTSVASSFTNHVRRIFSGGSKKQVIGADTSRVVARMTDKQSGGNWAYINLVRDPMSPQVFLSGLARRILDGQYAVTVPANFTGPVPATVAFLHLTPKSFHNKSLIK